MSKKHNRSVTKALFKKEILDVIRDKKTLIMMIVVPVILYPLIFIVAMQAMVSISGSMEAHTYNIAVSGDEGDAFVKKLTDSESVDYSLNVTFYDSDFAYKEALSAEETDVFVSCETEDGKPLYRVYYLSSVTNSSYAADIVWEILGLLREDITREKIEAAGLDYEDIIEPISYEGVDTASGEQSMGSILGSILPFMLIVSLIMGTMYPAIDTTAGEKERGTLETILTLPVTNRQLIVSKFLTVAIIGIISALINLISMGGIGLYMYNLMGMTGQSGGVSLVKFVPSIIICVLAVLAFSLFISAMTMCITAFAKSFKEANNYITPFMLVVMFIGFIGFIPNVELNAQMAVIPVANICLLIKNIMLFKINYSIIALVLISNIAYAALAIMFLSKIYDSEAILFGDMKNGIQIFEKRSNIKKGGVPSTGDAWLLMAVTILLIIYAGGMISVKSVTAGTVATQAIILLLPLCFAIYTKKDLKKTYSMKKTGALGYVGGIVLMAGAILIGLIVTAIISSIFPESAVSASAETEELMSMGFPAALIIIAVIPAFCEELMFRGFIFSAMRNRYKISTAIIIVAAIFGIYHMSIVRFFTTGLLGAVLCYAVYKTGSILPAVIMHFLNNALSVIESYYPEQVGKVMPFLVEETVTVSDVLITALAGVVLFALGILILKHTGKKISLRD